MTAYGADLSMPEDAGTITREAYYRARRTEETIRRAESAFDEAVEKIVAHLEANPDA